MPLIQVKLMEAFMPTQKKEIVGQLTGAVVSIEEKDISSVTWVTIEEVCSGEWSIGGQDVTTDAGAPPCRRQ
jgi:4-oxalocrotonate tautomerase